MRVSESERGRGAYRDEPDRQRLISPLRGDSDFSDDDDSTRVVNSPTATTGAKTPNGHGKFSSRSSSSAPDIALIPAHGSLGPDHNIVSGAYAQKTDEHVGPVFGAVNKLRNTLTDTAAKAKQHIQSAGRSTFAALPAPLQEILSQIGSYASRFFAGLWEFMNPPLWAMLMAIVVASVPQLQHLFFDKGTFIRNSVSRAVEQSGGVAVPLILVVLGGNLARNTLPREGPGELGEPKMERKLLVASLVSRMLMPTLLMAPLLAITAKYVPVSIFDDKIFIIVCFLLTGAPTALQLAQICQINNVYMPVMSKILFQSYVIWILPSTLMLVLLALETVEWAERGR